MNRGAVLTMYICKLLSGRSTYCWKIFKNSKHFIPTRGRDKRVFVMTLARRVLLELTTPCWRGGGPVVQSCWIVYTLKQSSRFIQSYEWFQCMMILFKFLKHSTIHTKRQASPTIRTKGYADPLIQRKHTLSLQNVYKLFRKVKPFHYHVLGLVDKQWLITVSCAGYYYR